MANQIRRRRLAVLSIVIVACLHMNAEYTHGNDAPPAPVTTTPITAYQSALDAMMQSADRDELNRRIADLIKVDPSDRTVLMEQLLLFVVRSDEAERRRQVAGHVLKALRDEKEAVVRVLARQLDHQDDAIRAAAGKMLAVFEDRSAVRPPDFSAYRAIIEDDVRAERPVQVSLVEHMFEADAGAALKMLVRAYQFREPDEIREILWIEHVVAELLWKRDNGFVKHDAADAAVQSEIDKASRHDRWWVRLYAAKIVAAHPEFARDGVIKRLSDDAHPSVSATAKRAKVTRASDE